jgi:RNA polymerase sigma factor (sigma-70 family)
MIGRSAFEAEWPRIEKRLHRSLWHRRVPPTAREDLVQETGLRLFKVWERVDPERDPWPLALTIALNALRDQMRSESRQQKTQLDDAIAEPDAETAALARIELDRVHDALARLTAPQRSALLAEVGVGSPLEEGPAAQKMLRLRARKRLRGILDGAYGFVGFLGGAAYRRGRSLRRWIGSGEQVAAYAPVAAGVLAAVAIGGFAWDSHPIHRPLAVPEHGAYVAAAMVRPKSSSAPVISAPVRQMPPSALASDFQTPRVTAPSGGGNGDAGSSGPIPDGYSVSATVSASAGGHSVQTFISSHTQETTYALTTVIDRLAGRRTPSELPDPHIDVRQDVDGKTVVHVGTHRIRLPY